ncbi:MAG TPA: hypothetical protein VFP55_06895, partial [Solirubrobacteraceae bacterium]|nr:hypothetical protein [Solirubrobacteraceae bacterium]
AAGPVGTGMSLSGARNDTVMDNTFAHNNAWGTIFVPFPDSGPPCTGGFGTPPNYPSCWYDDYGDALLNNTYTDNGAYGNPSNGDFGVTNLFPNEPTDCFSGNRDTKGPLTGTPYAETMYPKCQGNMTFPSSAQPQSATFTVQVACDSTLPLQGQKSPCPPGSSYPRRTHVVMHALPRHLRSMPNPCRGVPRNPWCPAHKKKK